MAHSFAAPGNSSPGVFLLRLEDGRDLPVRVPRRDLSRQCLPWLPAGSTVTVCEDSSAYFRSGQHEQAIVVVLWRPEEKPVLWLMSPDGEALHKLSESRPVVDELLSLTNWNDELSQWMAMQDPDSLPKFDDQRILAYSRWGWEGDACRLVLELAPMEDGESGVFFWDGENYVHYSDWGQ